MSSYNGSLVITIKPKAKYKFCTNTMLLFVILQKSALTKATYFSKIKPITLQNVWILHQMTQASLLPHSHNHSLFIPKIRLPKQCHWM
jgi:hypothetical protein